MSLPFLPDLHVKVERSWKKLYSAWVYRHEYASMPLTEETFADCLSMGDVLMLKIPTLLSKPLKTSKMNGRAYAAAGQAGGASHTMVVLQAFQADLLKDLDNRQGLSP